MVAVLLCSSTGGCISTEKFQCVVETVALISSVNNKSKKLVEGSCSCSIVGGRGEVVAGGLSQHITTSQPNQYHGQGEHKKCNLMQHQSRTGTEGCSSLTSSFNQFDWRWRR